MNVEPRSVTRSNGHWETQSTCRHVYIKKTRVLTRWKNNLHTMSCQYDDFSSVPTCLVLFKHYVELYLTRPKTHRITLQHAKITMHFSLVEKYTTKTH